MRAEGGVAKAAAGESAQKALLRRPGMAQRSRDSAAQRLRRGHMSFARLPVCPQRRFQRFSRFSQDLMQVIKRYLAATSSLNEIEDQLMRVKLLGDKKYQLCKFLKEKFPTGAEAAPPMTPIRKAPSFGVRMGRAPGWAGQAAQARASTMCVEPTLH